MRNGTCADCASTEVYKTDFSPLQAGDSLVRLYNPKGNNLAIEVYLCCQLRTYGNGRSRKPPGEDRRSDRN